jgi:DNA-binding winged helix-turn-helix (wHTH) protein
MSNFEFEIDEFRVAPAANRIVRGDSVTELEPKVMDLLVLFAGRPGEVVPKADIAAALWAGVEVNDDALTRTLWKLRQALGDEARAPRYIETVPKRGYRLIAAVETVAPTPEPAGTRFPPLARASLGAGLLAAIALAITLSVRTDDANPVEADPLDDPIDSLLEEPIEDPERIATLQRADAFYARYTRTGNEAALRLYETVLTGNPDDAAALAGLSNALAQRVMRFTGPDGEPGDRTSLTEALASGWLEDEAALPAVQRAEALARRATELDPGHPRAWRALGLALSMRREFDHAETAYNRALVIEPDDWGSLVNLSEIARLTGRDARDLAYLEQAWEAMSRRLVDDAVLVLPWQSRIGLQVATRRREAGDLAGAESWYRRVLATDPLNSEAVTGLAGLLRDGGDLVGADALCAELEQRTGESCSS